MQLIEKIKICLKYGNYSKIETKLILNYFNKKSELNLFETLNPHQQQIISTFSKKMVDIFF